MMRGHCYAAGDIALLAPRAALPWTICVLFYGSHSDLCRRFLTTLYRFTDPAAFRLRAGLNAVCPETRRMVEEAADRHGNVLIHDSDANLFKTPMMRRLFYEPPLDADWVVWFDDDSYVKHPGWIMDLAMAMERERQSELFGSLHVVDASHRVEAFIRSAHWYRGESLLRNGEGGPAIVFPVGGFWAARSSRLIAIDWPDRRLVHFEDDYLMGEAFRQQGAKVSHVDSGVCIDAAVRRAPASAPLTLRLDHPEE